MIQHALSEKHYTVAYRSEFRAMFTKTFQMRIAGTRFIRVICTDRHKTTCSKPHTYGIVQINPISIATVRFCNRSCQTSYCDELVHCLLMGLLKRPHKYSQWMESERSDCTWRADKKPGSPGLKAAGVASSTSPNIGKYCAHYWCRVYGRVQLSAGDLVKGYVGSDDLNIGAIAVNRHFIIATKDRGVNILRYRKFILITRDVQKMWQS